MVYIQTWLKYVIREKFGIYLISNLGKGGVRNDLVFVDDFWVSNDLVVADDFLGRQLLSFH